MKPTHTPPRAVRVPDGLWAAAKAKAAEQGTTVSEVMLKALEKFSGTKR